jgi:Protein of unknown function (DUF1501)
MYYLIEIWIEPTAADAVSRDLGAPVLKLADGVDLPRLRSRQGLIQQMERSSQGGAGSRDFDHFRRMAADILLSPPVRAAFDLEREPPAVHQAYGEHLCGKSVLPARRLIGPAMSIEKPAHTPPKVRLLSAWLGRYGHVLGNGQNLIVSERNIEDLGAVQGAAKFTAFAVSIVLERGAYD